MRSGYWQDQTTEDFGTLDAEAVIALLPVSATEQHGPHLPLGTDAEINRGVVARLLELLPDDLSLLVLPALEVGHSPEHSAFPGTLTVSPEILLRLWSEIGACVARAGLRKLVIFNSHGGQPQIVDLVALELRVRHGLLVVKANSFALGVPEGLFGTPELEHGIHGGGVETSMMLALRPELVRRDRIANFEPGSVELARRFERLRANGPTAFAWAMQDLHPAGACGDARGADADRGARLVEHLARELLRLLDEVRRFPLETLRAGPLDAP